MLFGAVQVLWNHNFPFRSITSFNSHFLTSNLLCLSLIRIGKVIDAVISTTARTSWYQMGALSLAGTIGHGTVFMLCYSAYLAFWADVHIHGHLKSHEYRYSRAPWLIFYGAALAAVFCGAVAQLVNMIFVLPPYLTLEVWTVIMCAIMILGTIIIGMALWRVYPPEDRRAKQISVHMQLVVLFFLTMCFLLRARIIWIPSGSTSASMYLQLSRFVFQASEWLAIGVMLIFTFPRRTAGQMVLPSSEVVRVQWKRTRIAMGVAASVAFIVTIANSAAAIIEPSRTRAPAINNTQHLIFKIIDGTGAGLSALTMMAAGALFLNTFWKRKSSIRPLVLLLVSIASVAGCFCFAVVMSLVIAVYPFDNVTKTLIATSGCSTANMIVRVGTDPFLFWTLTFSSIFRPIRHNSETNHSNNLLYFVYSTFLISSAGRFCCLPNWLQVVELRQGL